MFCKPIGEIVAFYKLRGNSTADNFFIRKKSSIPKN